MIRALLAFALLGLGACSSTPKPVASAPRTPSSWSEKVVTLQLEKPLTETKVTLNKSFDLPLAKSDFTLSWGVTFPGLAIPTPNVPSISTDYLAFFQNGSVMLPKELANTSSPVCAVGLYGTPISISLSNQAADIQAHFANGGTWSDDLLRKFKVTPKYFFREAPRDISVSQVRGIPQLKAQSSDGYEASISSAPRNVTSANGSTTVENRFSFGRASSQPGFSLVGTIKSFHFQTSVNIYISCYFPPGPYSYVFEQGRWTEILKQAMGGYITVENLNLRVMNPAEESPEIAPIPINLKGVPKSDAKTIEI